MFSTTVSDFGEGLSIVYNIIVSFTCLTKLRNHPLKLTIYLIFPIMLKSKTSLSLTVKFYHLALRMFNTLITPYHQMAQNKNH